MPRPLLRPLLLFYRAHFKTFAATFATKIVGTLPLFFRIVSTMLLRVCSLFTATLLLIFREFVASLPQAWSKFAASLQHITTRLLQV
jgi:hypothetical protein